MSAIYHRNAVCGGPSVKGVDCRRCGAYVGLVEGKGGRWYTCELHRSLGENSSALVAYPFQPHAKVCGRAQREQQARESAREDSLRSAIRDAEARLGALPADGSPRERVQRELLAESITIWQECLVAEGYEA